MIAPMEAQPRLTSVEASMPWESMKARSLAVSPSIVIGEYLHVNKAVSERRQLSWQTSWRSPARRLPPAGGTAGPPGGQRGDDGGIAPCAARLPLAGEVRGMHTVPERRGPRVRAAHARSWQFLKIGSKRCPKINADFVLPARWEIRFSLATFRLKKGPGYLPGLYLNWGKNVEL